VDWSDVLTAALAFFLLVTGLGLGYLLYRMAGLFMSLSRSVDLMTDETVPILSRAQITMDGVNQEIGRVDEIMISAVNATKGTEKAVTALSRGITAPVRKLSGLSAGVLEAVATFRSRWAAEAADRDYGRSDPPPPPPPPPPSAPLKTAPRPAPANPPRTEQAATSVSEAAAAATRPPPARGWTDQRAKRAAAAASAGAPPPPPAAPTPATDQGAGGWAEQRAKRAAAARGGGGSPGGDCWCSAWRAPVRSSSPARGGVLASGRRPAARSWSG